MAARNSELPEGTDHIVNGAMERDTNGGNGGSFVGGTAGATDDTGRTATGIRGHLRDGARSLTSQAGEKARDYVTGSKGRASDTLDDLSRIMQDAATSIDQKLGAEYGDYARKAANAMSDFSRTIRDKEVDELLDDARAAIRKSPAVAIGTAAAVGFALVRLVKAGLEEAGADTRKKSGGKRKTGA